MYLNITNLRDNNNSIKLSVSDNVFAKKYNESLIHQVICTYMNNNRQGTKAQKNRSEVSGGGCKPWRQKGTGRARAGSIRSPLWRKGGVTFAVKPKKYDQKLNRKMYRSAIQSILSEIIRKNNLLVIKNFNIINNIKTKNFIEILNNLAIKKGLIIVTPLELTKELYLSSRNIKNIKLYNYKKINPVDLISFHKVIITQDAMKQIEENLK